MEQLEQQLAEALGVDMNENNEGQQEQVQEEVLETEPAREQNQEGANEQDPAEPAGEDHPPMTLEERRANAERRRAKKTQDAVDAAVAKVRAEDGQKMDAFVASLGMVNSYTKEPITTQAQLTAWQAQHKKAQAEQTLAEGKFDQNVMDQLLGDNPTMQRMQQFLDQQQGTESTRQQDSQQEASGPQAEPTQAQQLTAEDQDTITGELAEIHKLNPNINGVADLLQMKNYKTFEGYVDRGFTFLEAYQMANMNETVNQRATNAAAAAQRASRGKSHLVGTQAARGGGDVTVPADELYWYRQLNKGASDDEIQRFANKDAKLHGRR